MKGVIDLSLVQVLSAYIFVLILLVIVKRMNISREREIIVASIRMTLQLVATGYVLVYLFGHPHPFFTIVVILAMEFFAVYNIYKRVKLPLDPPLKKVIAFSMVSGTMLSLLYFIFIVVRVTPWYNPQYFIPIAGMLIGNSMTGISLGVTTLADGMTTQRSQVESALMLGATPKKASKMIVDKAFDAAILPTINSMVGMGIIFLPGMMTGQILSGISPLTAIQYQIAIMMGIMGSVSLSVLLFVHLGYKTYFNDKKQLI